MLRRAIQHPCQNPNQKCGGEWLLFVCFFRGLDCCIWQYMVVGVVELLGLSGSQLAPLLAAGVLVKPLRGRNCIFARALARVCVYVCVCLCVYMCLSNCISKRNTALFPTLAGFPITSIPLLPVIIRIPSQSTCSLPCQSHSTLARSALGSLRCRTSAGCSRT